jgi:hypothetical protein
MNRILTRLGFTAVAILAGMVPAMAQAAPKSGDLDFGIKVHAGATAGSLKDDMHAQNMLGLGLEGSFALNTTSAIFGELTFSAYGAGKGYDNTKLTGTVYASDGLTAVGATPVTLALASSVDYRKNTLQGFSVRSGYRATFSGMWAWQAGLVLDHMQYRQEANGTLQPRVGAGAYGNLEGFAVTPTKSAMGIGAFAGLKAQFSTNFSFETNLVSVGYSSANYQPHTYTGMAPAVTTQTRHGVLLEVAFGLKL